VLGILVVYLPLLWGWDYAVDPSGARATIGLRLTFLLIFPLVPGFWSGRTSRRFLEVATLLAMLLVEALFVQILTHLHGGMERGLAGFLYVMLILILATQWISLAYGIACTLGAALLPHVMAALGLAPGLSQVRYALLIWPAAGLTILSQAAIAFQYLRRHELEQQLIRLADTDSLSGVRNRRYFMPRLETEAVRARRFGQSLSLLMLDIDRFKRVNDDHGHPTGDLVIRRLADLCGDGLRQIDVIARVGGEEFTLLLPGTTIEGAAEVAERIRAEVEGAVVYSLANVPVNITVSIGVAELRPEDKDGLALFVRADAALYAAKEEGRNRVVTR
jgi:diguanylate cyclase (GGDEF)-like protein